MHLPNSFRSNIIFCVGLFFAFGSVTFFGPLALDVNEHPSFGPGAIFITSPQQDVGYPIELSPGGRYAFALGQDDAGLWLNVWDLVSYEGLTAPVAPAPTWTVQLAEPVPRAPWPHVTVPDPILVEIAAAPGDSYVVVETLEQLQVLTVPELELTHVLPGIAPNAVAWSGDGRLLAVQSHEDTEIVVLDIDTGAVHQHELMGKVFEIRWIDGEWFLFRSGRDDPIAFATCASHLEVCTPFFFDGYVDAISADGQSVILAHSTDHGLERIVLQQQATGTYVVNENYIEISNPDEFSPSGKYITGGDFIYSFPEMNIVQQSALNGHFLPWPLWLPHETETDAYVVVLEDSPEGRWSRLNLYQVGEPDPVDELHLNELTGIPALEEYTSQEFVRAHRVSDDGRWVVVNFGRAALVVPIEYE